jgi:hypothetical protein
MSVSKEKMNIGAEKCSYAKLVGATQQPCHVQSLYENVHVCNGCKRYSSAIPAEYEGVLGEPEQARKLIASFISGEIDSTTYRPLFLVHYENNMATNQSYAEMATGADFDPSSYASMQLKFSGGLSMVVRLSQLEAAAKSELPGMPFDRTLVEEAVGKLRDEEFHAVQKLLVNGWSFRDAELSELDDRARLFFYRGYERKYTHQDGTEGFVFHGINATITLGE